jgi:hypothetical protein
MMSARHTLLKVQRKEKSTQFRETHIVVGASGKDDGQQLR